MGGMSYKSRFIAQEIQEAEIVNRFDQILDDYKQSHAKTKVFRDQVAPYNNDILPSINKARDTGVFRGVISRKSKIVTGELEKYKVRKWKP